MSGVIRQADDLNGTLQKTIHDCRVFPVNRRIKNLTRADRLHNHQVYLWDFSGGCSYQPVTALGKCGQDIIFSNRIINLNEPKCQFDAGFKGLRKTDHAVACDSYIDNLAGRTHIGKVILSFNP